MSSTLRRIIVQSFSRIAELTAELLQMLYIFNHYGTVSTKRQQNETPEVTLLLHVSQTVVLYCPPHYLVWWYTQRNCFAGPYILTRRTFGRTYEIGYGPEAIMCVCRFGPKRGQAAEHVVRELGVKFPKSGNFLDFRCPMDDQNCPSLVNCQLSRVSL